MKEIHRGITLRVKGDLEECITKLIQCLTNPVIYFDKEVEWLKVISRRGTTIKLMAIGSIANDKHSWSWGIRGAFLNEIYKGLKCFDPVNFGLTDWLELIDYIKERTKNNASRVVINFEEDEKTLTDITTEEIKEMEDKIRKLALEREKYNDLKEPIDWNLLIYQQDKILD